MPRESFSDQYSHDAIVAIEDRDRLLVALKAICEAKDVNGEWVERSADRRYLLLEFARKAVAQALRHGGCP